MNREALLKFLLNRPERWAAVLLLAGALAALVAWRKRRALANFLQRRLAQFDLSFASSLQPPARGPRHAPGLGVLGWRASSLLLAASFATLFFELFLIRWIAVEVRLFAYFKNLALIGCFLGFGLGCYAGRRRANLFYGMAALATLVLLVRLPALAGVEFYSLLSDGLALSPDAVIWADAFHHASLAARVELAVLCGAAVALFLLLLVAIFVPFGQIVGRSLDEAENTVAAYSVNLAGSLAGILAFMAACAASLAPPVWMAVGLASTLACYGRNRRAWLAGGIVFLATAALLWERDSPELRTYWSPYQQLAVRPVGLPEMPVGYHISVNHTGYMSIINMDPEFVGANPRLFPEMPFNPYDLPFRLARECRRVLIVGAGAGNDAAAALRHKADAPATVEHVDAVEIDPLIYRLGRQLHPERPYQDARLHMSVTDARAFLRRAEQPYDLIIFGLLDSHTQLSDYSNMRVDNYVYTLESLQEARRLLKPDGLLVLKFEVRPPWTWIGDRLRRMLETVFHRAPLVFFAPAATTVSATVFAVSPSAEFPGWLSRDAALLDYLRAHPAAFEDAAPSATTDDWPYLYHRQRAVPRTYLVVSLILVLLAIILVRAFGRFEQDGAARVNWRFFFLGAGFLLLETQVISRLALYFGTTWQVNGVVIAAVLSMLLLANVYVTCVRVRSLGPYYAGLFLALGVNYFFPLARLPFGARQIGALAAVLLAAPVFFAGIIFVEYFRRFPSRSQAFGSNLLGAVCGGLLENLSFLLGMKALLLVAVGVYGFSALSGNPRPVLELRRGG